MTWYFSLPFAVVGASLSEVQTAIRAADTKWRTGNGCDINLPTSDFNSGTIGSWDVYFQVVPIPGEKGQQDLGEVDPRADDACEFPSTASSFMIAFSSEHEYGSGDGQFDLLSVATHEMGHFFCLDDVVATECPDAEERQGLSAGQIKRQPSGTEFALLTSLYNDNNCASALSAFVADTVDGHYRLQWTTSVEKQSAGFQIWRLGANDVIFSQVGSLIASAGGEWSGASYTLVDSASAIGDSCVYRIVEVASVGEEKVLSELTLP